MLSADDPLGIAIFIRDQGYSATLEKESYGDPMIRSKVAGINYSILFYDCFNERMEYGKTLRQGLC
jgi:hypothetical protein